MPSASDAYLLLLDLATRCAALAFKFAAYHARPGTDSALHYTMPGTINRPQSGTHSCAPILPGGPVLGA
eukprot:1874770-Rhodomonas_salina.1